MPDTIRRKIECLLSFLRSGCVFRRVYHHHHHCCSRGWSRPLLAFGLMKSLD